MGPGDPRHMSGFFRRLQRVLGLRVQVLGFEFMGLSPWGSTVLQGNFDKLSYVYFPDATVQPGPGTPKEALKIMGIMVT